MIPERSFSAGGYRFGFNGKENDNEVKGTGNSWDFGARIYDPRLGRWLSVEPLQKKYPGLSTFCYANNNPILFLDIDGKDWFVNNMTGQVVYIKDASKVSADVIKSIGTGGNPNDYERLGPNDMFGKKVNDAYGNNILERDIVLPQSELFMNRMGYAKAEKVGIEETEVVSDPMDDYAQTTYDMKQHGDSKITYTKPDQLNTKKDKETTEFGNSSELKVTTITYKLTKPFGQDNSVTAEFTGNLLKSGSFWSMVKQSIGVMLDLYTNKKQSKKETTGK